VNKPPTWVDTFPTVTVVGDTPVWSWKAEAGIGGVEDPVVSLFVELVEEQAVSSPATSTRQMENAERVVRRLRVIN